MWHDLKHSIRQIKANRLFSFSAILLLSVGIGSNVLIFTFLNAFLLRPLPVRRPETLLLVEKVREHQIRSDTRFGFHQFELIEGRRDLFLAAVVEQEWDKASLVTLNDGGSIQLVTTQIVSPNYFSELGISAAIGRMLTTNYFRKFPGTGKHVAHRRASALPGSGTLHRTCGVVLAGPHGRATAIDTKEQR